MANIKKLQAAGVLGGQFSGPSRFGIGSNRNKGGDTVISFRYHGTRSVRRTGAAWLKDPVLRVPWFYVSSTNVETNCGNGATVYASIEYPAGVFWQAKKSGSAGMAVTDGATFDFDPIIGLKIPAFTNFIVHYFGDIGSAGNQPANNFFASRLGDGIESHATTLTNKTMTGGQTAANSTGQRGFTPLVLGTIKASGRDAIIFGDSIANGAVDSSSFATGGDAYGNVGAFERLCGLNGINYINFGRDATKLSQWQAGGALAYRLAALTGLMASVGINELGRNDSVSTDSAMATWAGTINGVLKTVATKAVGVTITPASTSTDSWATPGNQTTAGGNLVAYNARVRAGTISNQTGYLDHNATLRDSTDEMKWNSPGGAVNPTASAITPDGTHPTALGAQIATANMNAAPLL